MKQLKYFFFLPVSIILISVSCTRDTDLAEQSGNWIVRASLGGPARYKAVSFVLYDTAYVATGYDGTYKYNDTWAFYPDANNAYGAWQQKASIPAPPPASGSGKLGRSNAVGFAITLTSGLMKGYLATGLDGDANRMKDTWEYDPKADSWAQKLDFPEKPDPNGNANGRYDASAFGIGAKGYLTCGFNGNPLSDLWIFDPTGTLGTWTQGTNFPGFKRSGAVAFVYNNLGYLATGQNNTSTASVNDFWSYDPNGAAGGLWTKLKDIANTSTDSYDDDYTDIVRSGAVAFVMNNASTPKAYITTGQN
ncbi:hypothetical protein F5148DRAFT_1155174, partial [Russula earlei]